MSLELEPSRAHLVNAMLNYANLDRLSLVYGLMEPLRFCSQPAIFQCLGQHKFEPDDLPSSRPICALRPGPTFLTFPEAHTLLSPSLMVSTATCLSSTIRELNATLEGVGQRYQPLRISSRAATACNVRS